MAEDIKPYSIPQPLALDGVIYPGLMVSLEGIKDADNLTPELGDVLMASYPRSGSTWLLQAISLIQTRGDISAANAVSLHKRIPFLESKSDPRGRTDSTRPLKGFAGRIMRTHLKYHQIAKLVHDSRLRTIVVMRNPKDMLVSWYHFHQVNTFLGSIDSSWDEFFEIFKNKKLAFGDWLDHISGYWKNCSGLNNVLFIQYEEAKSDIHGTLQRISAFLNQKLDDAVLHSIADHISLQNMKKNPSANYEQLVERGWLNRADAFIRKGEVGGWRKYFSEEQRWYVDDHYVKAAEHLGILFKDKVTCEDIPGVVKAAH